MLLRFHLVVEKKIFHEDSPSCDREKSLAAGVQKIFICTENFCLNYFPQHLRRIICVFRYVGRGRSAWFGVLRIGQVKHKVAQVAIIATFNVLNMKERR